MARLLLNSSISSIQIADQLAAGILGAVVGTALLPAGTCCEAAGGTDAAPVLCVGLDSQAAKAAIATSTTATAKSTGIVWRPDRPVSPYSRYLLPDGREPR